MTTGSWIDDWWNTQRAELVVARLEADAADPGVPARYGTCTGAPTPHPWSAVAGVHNPVPGATRSVPPLMNLDRLHREVLALLGVKPA